jgi:nucleoside-diphosphate-sugar epimerase
MLRGHRIIVTGPAGQIAFPIVAHLAPDNDVWGVGLFPTPEHRAQVEDLGVTVVECDLGSGQLDDVPTDADFVLHLAVAQGPSVSQERAFEVNAEGTGLLLAHCRAARAVLVMSTAGIYRPHADPWHPYLESDPLGVVETPFSPTYGISKLAQEMVARTAARVLGLPTVVPRMNAAYGPRGGLPAFHLDAVRSGRPVSARSDPSPYSPIHQDDINAQVEALLGAASVPATVVNWGGDEVVTIQEWVAEFGRLTGCPAEVVVDDTPGSQLGMVADPARRAAITGPCRVGWREGMGRLVAERPAP